MSLYKRGEVWWADIVVPGRPRDRRTTGTTDRQEAQRVHDERKAALWVAAPKTSEKTFKDAIAIWLETGPKDLSDRYRLRAAGLSSIALSALDEEVLAQVLSRHQGATRNRVINLLRAVLQSAVKRGWMPAVPHMARVKVAPSRVRWLTADEWLRLQRELPCHLRQMARFAVATGLRENNIIELEWGQVDMERRLAWVHPDRAKARHAIGVPLSDDAIAVLTAQQGLHTRFVFVYNGKPVTKTSTKAWWGALKTAQIEGFRWHDLRHTWASWHVMAGTPLSVLQKLGGWQTTQMVARYAHLAPDHVAQYAGNAKPYDTDSRHSTQ